MKTLVGLVRPDEGTIRFGGEELLAPEPAGRAGARDRAREPGAELVPELSVEENIFLGGIDVPLLYRRRAVSRAARADARRLGLEHVPLNAAVE